MKIHGIRILFFFGMILAATANPFAHADDTDCLSVQSHLGCLNDGGPRTCDTPGQSGDNSPGGLGSQCVGVPRVCGGNTPYLIGNCQACPSNGIALMRGGHVGCACTFGLQPTYFNNNPNGALASCAPCPGGVYSSYSETKKQCISCMPPYSLKNGDCGCNTGNEAGGICYPSCQNGQVFDGKACGCPATQQWNPIKKACVFCDPAKFQHWNSTVNGCVTCDPSVNAYWSPATSACITCGTHAIFNGDHTSCAACPSGQLANHNQSACVAPCQGLQVRFGAYDSACGCPAGFKEAPSDPLKCACNDPLASWDASRAKCVKGCRADQVLNPAGNACWCVDKNYQSKLGLPGASTGGDTSTFGFVNHTINDGSKCKMCDFFKVSNSGNDQCIAPPQPSTNNVPNVNLLTRPGSTNTLKLPAGVLQPKGQYNLPH